MRIHYDINVKNEKVRRTLMISHGELERTEAAKMAISKFWFKDKKYKCLDLWKEST